MVNKFPWKFFFHSQSIKHNFLDLSKWNTQFYSYEFILQKCIIPTDIRIWWIRCPIQRQYVAVWHNTKTVAMSGSHRVHMWTYSCNVSGMKKKNLQAGKMTVWHTKEIVIPWNFFLHKTLEIVFSEGKSSLVPWWPLGPLVINHLQMTSDTHLL